LKGVLIARCLYTNKSQEALCKADETDIAMRIVIWIREPRTIRYNFILMYDNNPILQRYFVCVCMLVYFYRRSTRYHKYKIIIYVDI